MERRIAEIADRLIALSGADDGNRDIFEYALHILASLLVNAAVTIAIGIAFGVTLEMLAVFVSFATLRTVSGGYHAKTFAGCVAFSAVSMAAAIADVKFTPQVAMYPVSLVILILSGIAVFAFAPVAHENRPMSVAETGRFRKLSRIVFVAAAVAIHALFAVRAGRFGLGAAIGIGLSGAALLPAVCTKFRRRLR